MGTLSHLLILALHGSLICDSVLADGTMADIKRLKDKLFSDYSSEFRPVYNLSDTVTVHTNLLLLSVLDFDEVSGTINLVCILSMRWTDFQLTWNSSEFGGIQSVVFNSSYVWKPRIYMISSAEDLTEIGSDSFDVRIESNGSVGISPGKRLRSNCKVDMWRFPSDSHTCSIIVVPWMYLSDEVNLRFDSRDILMTYFTTHEEWNITDTSVSNSQQYSTHSTAISYTISLTRKPKYLILTMIIPVMLLVSLNPFVFLLPVSSGERISFTVTIFLSLAVYMSYIGGIMPTVSDSISAVSYFLLGTLCFSCVLIVLTILTIRFETGLDIGTLPKWLKSLVNLCICRRISHRKSITTRTAQSSVDDVRDNTECEKQDNDVHMDAVISKNDVINVIDKSLFWISEIILSIIVIIFIERLTVVNK